MAPKMVKNFIELCKGLEDGRGYQGSKIFRAKANDHILGGDFENDDGTGGRSAYEEKYFLAEQCPLKVEREAEFQILTNSDLSAGPERSNKNEGSGEDDRRAVSGGVTVHDLGGRPRVQGVQVHPRLRESRRRVGQAAGSLQD